MTQPGHDAVGKENLPGSYQPAPPVQNFAAPVHHLSNEQQKEVVALAEASHKDTQGGFMGQSTGSGLTGSSSGFGSNATDNIASTLGGGTGSATRSHGLTGGEYERSGNDLTGNRTGLTSGSGLGSGAAGAGALGAGAGAATGSTVYDRGLGSQGDPNARGGASAVEAKQHGKGGDLLDREFKNTAPSGTLESKLQDELERNAQKAGTHATGFGAHGTPAGSASLGNNSALTSGLTHGNNTSTTGAGYAAPAAGAAGLGAAGVGAGAAGHGASHGLHGQQGYTSTDPAAPHTGGHLADQLHGLGTQQPTEVDHFGTMQDHKRSNTEAAHLPEGTNRQL